MLPLLPLAIVALGGVSLWAAKKKLGLSGGVMTAERKIVLETALDKLTDPAQLNKLAEAFDAEGLHPQAILLRNRAKLRGLAPPVKAGMRAAFRKGMTSTNGPVVMQLANAFAAKGATGAAAQLQNYGQGVVDAAKAGISTVTAVPGEVSDAAHAAQEKAKATLAAAHNAAANAAHAAEQMAASKAKELAGNALKGVEQAAAGAVGDVASSAANALGGLFGEEDGNPSHDESMAGEAISEAHEAHVVME